MSISKNIFSGFEAAINEATKIATKIGYKRGAQDVLKEFGPHAGRALRNGDGSMMKTFNEVTRAIKKM
jgi:hypothetical protein